MLSAKTTTYASAGLAPEDDRTGVYFPDDVAGPFVTRIDAGMSGLFQKQRADSAALKSMNEGGRDIFVIDTETGRPRPLRLDESKNLVVAALTDFDPALGAKAQKILDHRMRAETFSPDREGAMQCYVAVGDTTYPQAQGTIQYDFLNGTIDDVVMLGHETGHAIADDYIREKGGASADFRENVPETQAYFVQNIVYDYLRNHPDKGIREAADKHFTATMAANMTDLALARVAQDAQDALNKGQDFDAAGALTDKLGPGWEEYKWASHVRDVIVTAQTAQKDTAMPEADRTAAMNELDKEVRRVHGRPMSILSGLALFQKAKAEGDGERRLTTGTLLGRNGAPSILNAFSAAGIDYPGAMDEAAQEAVSAAAGPQKNGAQFGFLPPAPAPVQS